MKRPDEIGGKVGLGRRVAVLLVAVAAALINFPTGPANAMTKIDDLVRKLDLESDYERRYQRSREIRAFVCQMDPAEYTDELVDKLIVLAVDDNEHVRTMTASALLCIGRQAKRAIPTLEKALEMVPPMKGWVASGGYPSSTIVYVIEELRKK